MRNIAALTALVFLLAACSADLTPGPGGTGSLSTQEPIDTAEPTATVEPVETPVPALNVTKVSLTASVRRGATASVTVKTAAKATCDIDVVYSSGSSTAAGLVTKKADSAGKATWSWKVGTRTKTGRYPIYITCTKGDREGELTLYFKVV